MANFVALLLVTFLVAGAAPALASDKAGGDDKGGPYPIWLSPLAPVQSIDQIDEAWARPFNDGVANREDTYHKWFFSKGEGEDIKYADAENCETIYALEKRGYEVQPGIGRPVYQGQRNGCDFLDQLRHVKPANESYVHDIELTEQSVDILPAFVEVGLSCDMICRYDEANRNGIPISRIWPLREIVSENGNELHFKSRDTEYGVYLLAKGDFDRDGLEDLFVNSSFSYYANSLRLVTRSENFILTRDKSDTILRVVNPESHLCSARPGRSYTYECHFDQSDLDQWLKAPL